MNKRIIVLPAIMAVAACGSETAATLHLFDAPPDGVTSVNIFVAAMDVHVVSKGEDGTDAHQANDASIDDDNKWKHLEVGKSIDLIEHEGEDAAVILGQLDLPQGKVTQIRLVIDKEQPNTVVFNNAECDLDLTQVSAKGVKINHVFKAFDINEGESHDMFIHFDLNASLTANQGCFALSPKLQLTKVKRAGKEVSL